MAEIFEKNAKKHEKTHFLKTRKMPLESVKVKNSKIGLRYVLSWPKWHLETKFHEAATFDSFGKNILELPKVKTEYTFSEFPEFVLQPRSGPKLHTVIEFWHLLWKNENCLNQPCKILLKADVENEFPRIALLRVNKVNFLDRYCYSLINTYCLIYTLTKQYGCSNISTRVHANATDYKGLYNIMCFNNFSSGE